MLLALASDLASCGHRVTIALEPSIQAAWKSCSLKSAALDRLEVHRVQAARCDCDPDIEAIATQWARIASACDTSIVIAPELDGLLPELVESLRRKGCSVRAPDAGFLKIASDKWETYQRWISQEQPTVPTWLASDWIESSDRRIAESPHGDAIKSWQTDGWVLKRRRGAGGTDMQRFSNRPSLIGKLRTLQDLSAWIVQPWILGQSVSLALAGAWGVPQGTLPKAFGPTVQLFGTGSSIDSSTNSSTNSSTENAMGCGPLGSYVGGFGPLKVDPHELGRFALGLLGALPLPGAKAGWIGVDFLILPGGPQIAGGPWLALEINARLTSSYLGYRKYYGPKLADTILGGPMPDQPFPNPGAFRFSVNDFHG